MKVLFVKSSGELVRAICLSLVAILVVAITPSAFAVKKTNIEQLEKFIASNKSKSDHSLAGKLYEMELTEQLSDTRLANDLAQLPGAESKEALTTLSEIAMFAALPKSDEVGDAAPDAAAAAAIFKSGQAYTGKLLPGLPNFFATRVITRFQDTPMSQAGPQANLVYEPLHKAGTSTVMVVVKSGHEVIDATLASKPGNDAETVGLNTEAEYGAMLTRVLGDAAQGSVKWSHWEKVGGATVAVFDYSVPQSASHYTVSQPWLDGAKNVQPGYHGQIAIKAADGTVVRFTMVAEMGSKDLVVKANQLVEYGEVQIGGKKYELPTRGIVYSLLHMQHAGTQNNYQTNGAWNLDKTDTTGPARTIVNEIRYSDYR